MVLIWKRRQLQIQLWLLKLLGQGAKQGNIFDLWANFIRQQAESTNHLLTCPVWKENNFQSLTDCTWTGTRSESIYCPLSIPAPRHPTSHLPCSEKVCQATASLNKLHWNSLYCATYLTCCSRKSHIICF